MTIYNFALLFNNTDRKVPTKYPKKKTHTPLKWCKNGYELDIKKQTPVKAL